MANIPVHPSALEGDTAEELAASKAFFVRCGLMREEDDFVSDPSVPDNDDEAEVSRRTGPCESSCTSAYEIAKAACETIIWDAAKRKKCRKKVKAAYAACLGLCEIP